ncbi:uncharacterized protein si:ch1073-220m6.1 isoform X1 [Channa argus]|uniref:uncharacterized protein si:ch1073-220m6.1 isoform X1 n=1 Tax=Channa argus TaxID=215402 RepID=UPI00352070EE
MCNIINDVKCKFSGLTKNQLIEEIVKIFVTLKLFKTAIVKQVNPHSLTYSSTAHKQYPLLSLPSFPIILPALIPHHFFPSLSLYYTHTLFPVFLGYCDPQSCALNLSPAINSAEIFAFFFKLGFGNSPGHPPPQLPVDSVFPTFGLKCKSLNLVATSGVYQRTTHIFTRILCASHSLTLKILRELKMFLLLSCWIISGIMAEDPSVTHYQLRNSSVCLHVRRPPPYNELKWSFAEKIIATSTSRNPAYADKVDYKPENHSLCIKELTDKDNGVYEFSFHDSSFHLFTEKHNIIVEDHVPTPVIKMSVLRSNLSARSCNISVNCSIQEGWLSSVCDEDSCITSLKSLKKVNITISTDNRTVVCSGSNHVSESNVSESKDTTCFTITNPAYPEELPEHLVIGQTSTSHLIQNQQLEAQSQPEPRVSTSSFNRAEAAYENVDAIHPNQTSSTRGQLGSASSQKVDTVYSILQRPKVTPALVTADSSNNTKRHHNTEQSSASYSANPLTAKQAMQIDTVYSLLQRPKKSEATAPPIGQ